MEHEEGQFPAFKPSFKLAPHGGKLPRRLANSASYNGIKAHFERFCRERLIMKIRHLHCSIEPLELRPIHPQGWELQAH